MDRNVEDLNAPSENLKPFKAQKDKYWWILPTTLVAELVKHMILRSRTGRHFSFPNRA